MKPSPVDVARARIRAQGGVLADPKGGPPPGWWERAIEQKATDDHRFFNGSPGSRLEGLAAPGLMRELLVTSAKEWKL